LYLFICAPRNDCGHWNQSPGAQTLHLSQGQTLWVLEEGWLTHSQLLRGCATLRKRTAGLPYARCEDRSLGAGAHSNARGALVDPVSYGQQSTTEGSWRGVEKEVAKCERHGATRQGEGERFFSDLKWSLIGRKRFLSLRIDVILNKIELSKNIQKNVTMV
jgi:hypothetical protein